MGKKYYCDYCDKRFKDNLSIRKNHINGLQHQVARNDHYAKFKDIREILAEECNKTPCSRIMQNRECMFGSRCRFSHFTPQQLWEFQQIVCQEDNRKYLESINKTALNIDVEGFLNKRNQKLLRDKMDFKPFWSYSSEIRNYVVTESLPPSLALIDVARIPSNFNEWGK